MAYKVSELDLKFLASLIHRPQLLANLEEEVSVSDFKDPIYYEIYSAIIDFIIHNKEITFPDLKFKFKGDTLFIELIDHLSKQEPISDVATLHEEMIERHKKNELSSLGSLISRQILTEDSKQVIDLAETKITQIQSRSKISACDVASLENSFIGVIKDKVERYRRSSNISEIVDIPTGFEQLDKETLGLPRRHTFIIAAGTNDGKTQLAIQMANAISSYGQSVGFFLLEGSKEEMLMRLCSLHTGISIMNIRLGNITDKQVDQITEVIQYLRENQKMYLQDTIYDVNDIVSQIKLLKMKDPNLSTVFVDNVNICWDRLNRSNNREQEISSISKKLNALAKSLNISIGILQQLNTNPDERAKGIPIRNNDLRDSKAPSHDAVLVIFIHFPDKYNDSKGCSKRDGQLILGKNKSGVDNKIIPVINEAHVARFKEVERAK